MKFFLALCFIMMTTVGFSAERIITIDANNPQRVLSRIPQLWMATFVDQGFKQTETRKGVWELTIKKLRCDAHTRDVLYPDYSNAGLPSVKCFINASVERGGKGKVIQESRFIEELISRIENHVPEAQYSDCAMGGKCSSFIKVIHCISDLNKEEMHDAFSCSFTAEK